MDKRGRLPIKRTRKRHSAAGGLSNFKSDCRDNFMQQKLNTPVVSSTWFGVLYTSKLNIVICVGPNAIRNGFRVNCAWTIETPLQPGPALGGFVLRQDL